MLELRGWMVPRAEDESVTRNPLKVEVGLERRTTIGQSKSLKIENGIFKVRTGVLGAWHILSPDQSVNGQPKVSVSAGLIAVVFNASTCTTNVTVGY